MKKIYLPGVILLGLVLLTGSGSVSAQTAPTTSLNSQIQALTSQLQKLQGLVGAGASTAASVVSPTDIKPTVQSVLPYVGSAAFAKDLYYGLKNSADVSSIQQFLTDEGYYGGPITGNFMSLTKQAVQKYQSSNGVSPTGYIGAKTRAVINGKINGIKKFVCSDVPSATGNIASGCVLPMPQLSITTDSNLQGTTGSPFSANFTVSGGMGNYDIQTAGEVPGLAWVGTACAFPANSGTVTICANNSIQLSGTPLKAGKFQVTITAKEIVVIPPCAQATSTPRCMIAIQVPKYGKMTFMVIVSGTGTGTDPVISGVKGPTTLNVGEEGTWAVNASDPSNGSLSYSVVWGDEAPIYGMMAPSAKMSVPFIQTATFSHKYQTAGTYQPTFTVVNDYGLAAKTSLSVNVGGVTPPPQTGTLDIQKDSGIIRPGETKKLTAMYYPPAPTCPPGMACPLMMPAPTPVDADWYSSDTSVVTVKKDAIYCFTTPCPQPLSATATGIKLGSAQIKAVYTTASGNVVTATTGLSVMWPGEQPPTPAASSTGTSPRTSADTSQMAATLEAAQNALYQLQWLMTR